jgi:hypothetical protein
MQSWTGFIWLRIGSGGKLLCCSNEHGDSIQCGKFVDYLRTFGVSGRTLLYEVGHAKDVT